MKKITTKEGIKFVNVENVKQITVIKAEKTGKFYIAVSYKDAVDNLLIGSFETREEAENVIINDLI